MKFSTYFHSLLVFTFVTSCALDKPEIEDTTWKYNGGYCVSDVIEFKYVNYNNDTAGVNDSAKILIRETSKANPFQRESMTIQSLKTGELGYYTGIGKRK